MSKKRACLVILAFALLTNLAYAALTATQHQNGHIRILNGTNAGISVTPAFLEFGNVTWGATITKQITVLNTGDCVEHINATASQGTLQTINTFIPQLYPQHSVVINATYNTATLTPGDYTFGIDWTATCN